MLPPFQIDHPVFSVRVKDASLNDMLPLFKPIFLRIGITKDGFLAQLLDIKREFHAFFVRAAFLQYLIHMRDKKRQVARRTQRAYGRPRVAESFRKEDAMVAEVTIADIVGRRVGSRPRTRSALGPRLMSAYMRSTGINESRRLRTARSNRDFQLLVNKLNQLIREDTLKENKAYNERSDDEIERDEARNEYAIDNMILHDGDFVRSIYLECAFWISRKGSRLEKRLMSFDEWRLHIIWSGLRSFPCEGNMHDFFIKFDKWRKMMPHLIRPSGVLATSVY